VSLLAYKIDKPKPCSVIIKNLEVLKMVAKAEGRVCNMSGRVRSLLSVKLPAVSFTFNTAIVHGSNCQCPSTHAKCRSVSQ